MKTTDTTLPTRRALMIGAPAAAVATAAPATASIAVPNFDRIIEYNRFVQGLSDKRLFDLNRSLRGCSIDEFEVIRRIHEFANCIEVDTPNLEFDEDDNRSLLWTDELMHFLADNGANFDWIFSGYVGGLVASAAKHNSQEYREVAMVRELDEAELSLLEMAMRAHLDDGLDFDGAMQVWTKAVKEYRTSLAA